ncbi:hypothetical protein [Bombella sp. ESL0385]|uniref:hypothetical protein n=1 Tax=Bombella sp. ESL0385 TaxID=2676446 RepID=UPI0012D8D739|nr:hypothetical protein [Bombella sp. ESL0385]MUG90746.1 hypothetical protein [Bombella sp. ESL0385]
METSDMPPTLAESTTNSESVPPRPPRALVAAVIIMGVMIIVGAAALVGIIIYRIVHHVPTPVVRQEAPALSSSLSGPALLSLPRRVGEQVTMMSARPDGALAVMLKDEQGNMRIVLWSPEQARIIAELTMTHPTSP